MGVLFMTAYILLVFVQLEIIYNRRSVVETELKDYASQRQRIPLHPLKVRNLGIRIGLVVGGKILC